MKKLFARLGLAEKEMELFLTMLELGAQPVSTISKRIGIPRSTTYLNIDKLKDMGLVDEFTQNNTKYFKCIPVKDIPDIISMKKKDIEATEVMLLKRLDKLQELENKLSITPCVKFFEGKVQVMNMYEKVLKEKEFYAIQNPELVKQMMPVYHINIPASLKQSTARAKELLTDCAEARLYKKLYESEKHQIRIMKGVEFFPSDTIITHDKIYMIAYGNQNVSATEIINRPLAESQRVIFDQLWSRYQ